MVPEQTLLEAETRKLIDDKLIAAGWVIQDKNRLNLMQSLGVAVREMDTDTGPADYMLFISGIACGIIEAKREGEDLGHVDVQSKRYATSNVKHIERAVAEGEPLPFLYEATNNEIRFRDERDPRPRSRPVFHFHQPETFKQWLEEGRSLRDRLLDLPELNTQGLRDCQIEAVTGIEHSLKQAKPRALLQMATGSGKTYTAVTQVYRLAKFAKAKRVLFLVDRGNLSTNAKDEFEQFVIPNDGRKFTQHYNVNTLGRAGIPDANKVTISTIQRMYAQLTNQELDDEADEHSGFEVEASSINGFNNTGPRPISYNPSIPIEEFDVIIIDECHRSIYNLWRQVLEYFDAFLIGLTATPTKKTIGFFNQNLVSEYTHEDAVADKVNVGYDIYRIKTEMTEKGNKIEAGTVVNIRDRLTKKQRRELLDKEEEWIAKQLDRSVLAPNQIRTVIEGYKERCLKECFPERSWVPKTLIFAKDDDHCDRIVDMVREVFNESNEFCKKITYKVGKKEAENAIKAFRTAPTFRIAVTVDMIATGTDIKALECVMFMRDVKSQSYYEQMKGRGTRVISIDELHKVTPDAPGKSRFVLVDCVGVTETDKTETKSLETKPSVSTEALMKQVARGDRHSDTLRALGNRMIRLDLKLNDQQRKHINELIKSLNLPLPLGEGRGEGAFEVREPVPEYLIENARELRKNQTDAESLLWQLLRDRQVLDCKFRRQHPIDPYILDFYCHDKKLAIELDGGQHNTEEGKAKDQKRTEFIETQGIQVLRFWNNDVLQNTESVLGVIYNQLLPHPNPLPEGEGYITLPLPLGEGRGEGGFLPPTTLTAIAANLIHATNEDKLITEALKAKGKDDAQGSASVAGDTTSGATVSEAEIQKTFKPEADNLIYAFHNPDLRDILEQFRKDTDQLIDDSPDKIDHAGTGYDVEKAEGLIKNWQQFIKDHQNELDAIQLIYQQPYQKRHLSYDMINQLVEAIEQPPYHIAPAEVWKAYEQLKKAKVKGAPPESKLPILISLIRLATGITDVLEPFTELVNNRFENWLKQQQLSPLPLGEGLGEGASATSPLGEGLGEGASAASPLREDLGEGVRSKAGFTPEQLNWLNKIKDQIAQNAEMTVDDFEYTPFNQEGGLLKARELFGKDLNNIIQELNGYLIA